MRYQAPWLEDVPPGALPGSQIRIDPSAELCEWCTEVAGANALLADLLASVRRGELE